MQCLFFCLCRDSFLNNLTINQYGNFFIKLNTIYTLTQHLSLCNKPGNFLSVTILFHIHLRLTLIRSIAHLGSIISVQVSWKLKLPRRKSRYPSIRKWTFGNDLLPYNMTASVLNYEWRYSEVESLIMKNFDWLNYIIAFKRVKRLNYLSIFETISLKTY